MRLIDALIHGSNDEPLGAILKLCPFRRTIELNVPLRPMTYLVTGSWLDYGTMYWIQLLVKARYPIKKVIGYSHSLESNSIW